MKETKVVPPGTSKKRLDEFLSEAFGVPRSAVKKWVTARQVHCDDKIAEKAGLSIKPGMKIAVDVPQPEPPAFSKDIASAEIIADEKEFLVVKKPAGIVTHCDAVHREDSLVQRVLKNHPLSSIGLPDRPGVVHRLDKDTSGLLLLAKTDRAHYELQQIFASRNITKIYLAMVHGTALPESGTIESPIMRDSHERKKMAVSASNKARHAVSHFQVLARGAEMSLLRVIIETGRTHQIRVHLNAIGYPVVGDDTYGNKKADKKVQKKFGKIPRLLLHASSLSFEFTGKKYSYSMDPPPDFLGFAQTTLGEIELQQQISAN